MPPTEGDDMATAAERMRALRERTRRGMWRLTNSADDLRTLAGGYVREQFNYVCPCSIVRSTFSDPGLWTLAVETALAEYLSHASVFLRKLDGEIIYWTVGAQELYGFTAEDAVGRVSHELLQTVFPEELAIIEARLHADKQWRGRLGHVTNDAQDIY